MLKDYLERLKEEFELKEKKADEYRSFKVRPMSFEAEAYESEKLGHVSYMKGSALFGLMKMETLVINPLYVDAPLISFDFIKVMKNVMVYAEQYDTNLSSPRQEEEFLKIRDRYADLLETDDKKYWYDGIRYGSSLKFKSKDTEKMEKASAEYFEECLKILKQAEKCDKEKKTKKVRAYSHGLIENGGPATDSFLKAWGKEKTEKFFDEVMFG